MTCGAAAGGGGDPLVGGAMVKRVPQRLQRAAWPTRSSGTVATEPHWGHCTGVGMGALLRSRELVHRCTPGSYPQIGWYTRMPRVGTNSAERALALICG